MSSNGIPLALLNNDGSREMNCQEQITLQIPKKGPSKADAVRFVHSDKIAGMLGGFPELTKAVRDGDLATVCFLCAQLFNSNSPVKILPKPHPNSP